MLTVRSKYRQILAFALAAFLLYALVLKEAHHLFVEHEHKHCSLNSPGQKHLHDGDLDAEDCMICLMTFSEYTPEKAASTNHHLNILYLSPSVSSDRAHKNHPSYSTQWRGPPTILV